MAGNQSAMSTTGRPGRSARMRLLAVSAVIAVVISTFAAASASAAVNYQIRGSVVCSDGQPVVGVWMESSGGGSGWAGWTRYPGRPHVARYARTFTTSLSTTIYLNVGCGGSPSRWASSSRTPSRTASSGAILFMNARCDPSAKKCGFPPLENNTPVAPSSNVFGSVWCTWRAAEFWRTMTGRYPNWRNAAGRYGDAGYWDDNASATGWRTEGVPSPDSLVVWQPGAAGALGHVGYASDTRVSNGILQMKIYDRNWDGNPNNIDDRNGVWVAFASQMRFIVAPPQTEAVIR